MFFQDKINNIGVGCRVLEIGPGGYPHPRSDVLLEKRFNDDAIAEAQRGYAPKHNSRQEIVYYDGGEFPFSDNEFDYVICSHVLEHIPESELDFFIYEMQRVGKRGFIEFPTIFYELLNYQDVHLWLMNYRDNTILFLDKKTFKSNYIHKIYREMFYGVDNYMSKSYMRYRELYFNAFVWENSITYKIVKEYDDLINLDDYLKYKTYFSTYKVPFEISGVFGKIMSKIRSIASRIKLFYRNSQL